jgi:hypothetical protein
MRVRASLYSARTARKPDRSTPGFLVNEFKSRHRCCFPTWHRGYRSRQVEKVDAPSSTDSAQGHREGKDPGVSPPYVMTGGARVLSPDDYDPGRGDILIVQEAEP